MKSIQHTPAQDERLQRCIESVDARLESITTALRREVIFDHDMNTPHAVVERAKALVESAQLLLAVARERDKARNGDSPISAQRPEKP